MAFDCVDIEKAFGSVPNKLAFEVMSCMKAGEAEVKAVEAIYKDNTAMVIFEAEISGEFRVRVAFMIGKYIDAPIVHYIGKEDIAC